LIFKEKNVDKRRKTKMYQRSKIYKITDLAYTECYYGSTIQPLSKRMGEHRSYYKIYKQDKYHFVSSFILFDKYGLENCKIELVEDYECKTKEELHQREGWWIKNNPCVNKTIAGRTKKEYHQDNKENIKEYKREYHQDNKDKINEHKREYHQDNKDKINEHKKEKVKCDICGKEVSRSNMSKHKKLHK
jgi:hypothetical protein